VHQTDKDRAVFVYSSSAKYAFWIWLHAFANFGKLAKTRRGLCV